MATIEKTKEAYELLTRVLAILESVNEHNWIRGIRYTIAYLTDEDGNLDPTGFEDARSTYRSMTEGARNFSDYAVRLDDKSEHERLNKELEDLQAKLWALFKP
jgi:hypothetical protein